MTNPTILVTAATGKTGAAVVEQLAARDLPVRALARRSDQRSERLAALGAEVIVGDLLDIDSLRAALDGVKRAYFVYPPAAGLLEATANLAVAGEEAGLEALVNMSQIIARAGHPSPLSRQHWLAERVLDRAAFGVVHIRPSFFAEMPFMLNGGTIAAEGRIYQAHGDGRHAPVAAGDIARAVVAILAAPEAHLGKTYVLTGPKALTQHDIARTFATVLGKPVEYVDVAVDDWKRAMAETGLPPFVVGHLGCTADDHRAGRFDMVTDAVREITGTAAQGFEDYVREKRDQLAA